MRQPQIADREIARHLFAVEAIKVLKARYLRAMDMRDWQLLRDTLTEDILFEHPTIGSHVGCAAVVAAIRSTVDRYSLTIHRASMPEVTVIDARTASGIWALHSCVQLPEKYASSARPLFHGYGRYHDRFRHEGGEWRIAQLRLDHLYRDHR